jgi:NTE family protein
VSLLGAPAGQAPSNINSKPARVALVLGGGGCRGYAHIGFLKALDAAGHRPDLIVGSSVGSMVGALYAAGISAAELERHGREVDTNKLRSWKLPDLGVFSGAGIGRFVEARIPDRKIEELKTRFAAVSTDLGTGAIVVVDKGDLGRAVQASSSLPGLFEPVRIDGRLCVDGNLVSPVPVGTARQLGAMQVIAVDITFPPTDANLGNPIDALYQGFSILTRGLALRERAKADVIVEPRIPVHSDMSAATLKALTSAGEEAGRAAMPAIAKLFAASRR